MCVSECESVCVRMLLMWVYMCVNVCVCVCLSVCLAVLIYLHAAKSVRQTEYIIQTLVVVIFSATGTEVYTLVFSVHDDKIR